MGPVVDEQYDYSIVSDSTKLSLFVLTRDVERYFAQYDAQVMAWLAANGWNTYAHVPFLHVFA